ncbi:OmpA family protein [uncultured Stenotrophomonas sp.]|uniref:OmpA family protein n=1 Tax=uncultured Stenotrophomonas sp. TaxID=165438 RepID=UPI0025D0A76E|nr:OmpA family protein [uncultured Stenotrophomonas sp.]
MNRKWTVLALLATLTACGKGNVREEFPDPARAYPAGGTYVNLDNLRQYAPGMNKSQVQELLGTPQFNEGLWGVRNWNYVFNFRRSVGAEPIQCQFQVNFDSKGVASGQRWKPDSCAALLEPAPAPVAPAPPPPPPVVAPLRLSADALFAFDSANLSAAGQAKLDEFVQDLRASNAAQTLNIIGYTDRIGSDAYNMDLSRRRAQSVRNHLVQRGIPAAAIHAEGRGNSAPLVQCDEAAGAALLDCLAPNRRVEIVVAGA